MKNKLVLGIALTLVSVVHAFGATVVSNLNATVAGSGTISETASTSQTYAQEFTTGATSVTLADIMADLGNNSGSIPVFAYLASNAAGGVPSFTTVASFNSPTIPSGSPTDVTFTPTSTVTLAANTNYWFVVSANGNGSFAWDYTNTLSSSIGNYAVSSNFGSTWTTGSGPFLLEVDSTTTAPEPSSMALAGVASGLVGLAALRFRKVRR